MKVNEYLVSRCLKLENDIDYLRRDYSGISNDLKQANTMIEHIKEIITCNIGWDAYNHLSINIDIGNNDFKTLLSILDIKPEDYK